jgi:hypothetical protein
MLFEGEGGGGGGEGGGNGAATTFTQEQVNDLIAREKGKITAEVRRLRPPEGQGRRAGHAQGREPERHRAPHRRTRLAQGPKRLAEAENMRLKVALKKGLTGDKAVLADRLTGATEAEMEADADKLLKLFGGGNGGTGFDGGARGGNGQPQSMDDLIRGARR